MHYFSLQEKIRLSVIEIINEKSLKRLEKRKSIVTAIVSKEVDCSIIIETCESLPEKKCSLLLEAIEEVSRSKNLLWKKIIWI